jgi:hypothetical protein
MKYAQITGGSLPSKQIEHTGVCDVCGERNCDEIYDAAVLVTPMRRIWAWTCPDCFAEGNGKLGIGNGQRYRRVT